MSADHVTIHETLPFMGGSTDAAGNVTGGYTTRGLMIQFRSAAERCSRLPICLQPGEG
jgi:myosin-crossreactive antigen